MARKLRIAVWYNLAYGGAKRALQDHVAGLTARGHEVHVFRPPLEDAHIGALSAAETEVPFRTVGLGKGYITNVVTHLMRSTLMLRWMEEHSQQCAKLIESGGFDIAFANTCMRYHAPFLGRYISKIPSLLYLQEPNRFLYEAIPTLPWLAIGDGLSWRGRMRQRFDLRTMRNQGRAERQNALSYDRILVNSYYSRESVSRAYGIQSHVCYLGIDSQRFRPSAAPRGNFLLGVGHLAVVKRPDMVIRAIGLLPTDKLSGARPTLIWPSNMGNSSYATSLDALAKECGVDFQRPGLVNDEQLLTLYQTAKCVIFPPRLEPFGYVPLEAAACGTPAIGVNEGGIRETMADGVGYLVEPTAEAISQQLLWVLNHSSEALAHSQANLQRVSKQWSLTAATDRLESHLIDLVDRR